MKSLVTEAKKTENLDPKPEPCTSGKNYEKVSKNYDSSSTSYSDR